MTDTLTIPDPVVLVGAYLRPLVDPLPVKSDMGSEADMGLARIRVTRIGGSPDPTGPLWTDRPLIRFESWGPTLPTSGDGAVEANANAETIRRLLASEAFLGTHSTGVVAYVQFLTMRDNPDDGWGGNTARARTTFDVQLWLHPLPA